MKEFGFTRYITHWKFTRGIWKGSLENGRTENKTMQLPHQTGHDFLVSQFNHLKNYVPDQSTSLGLYVNKQMIIKSMNALEKYKAAQK